MKSVEDITAFRTVARNVIADDGAADVVEVAEITPSGFRLARVPPALGRTLVDGDAAPDADAVLVIGFDEWRVRFASAPDIIGRHVRLGRTVHTIVGVMPDGFAFPVRHRFWTPLKDDPSAYARGAGPSVFIAGRLARGFDLAVANSEIAAIGERTAATFPDTHRYLHPEVVPYTYPFAGMSRSSADAFWPMCALVGLLLVVVAVNVAILIYARTASRLGEIAVRSALGASRARIVAQLFAECFVLCAVASVVGLGVAKAGIDWARSSLAAVGQSAFWEEYTLPGTALVYFAVLTVLAAVITGVIPALRATGRRVEWRLPHVRGGGLRMGRTWTTLIVVQVSIASAAIPIAIALGWFQVRDIFSVPNFPVKQILFAELELDQELPAGPGTSALPTAPPGRFAQMQVDLSRRLAAEPGVAGHAFTLDLPTMGRSWRVAVEHEHAGSASAPGATRSVERATIDLNFLRTFDLDVLAGRPFRAADSGEGSVDVVLVNRAFASRILGGGEALGRRIRYVSDARTEGRDANDSASARKSWYEIVGVVENIEENPFGDELVAPRVYHPLKPQLLDGSRVRLAVRVGGIDQQALGQRLRKIAASIDPALRCNVIPLAEAYRLQHVGLTSAAVALGVALLSVILLSAAGIYALMSFTVAQRRREIAILTALGAPPSRLLGGIFGQAARQIAIGVIAGVAIAMLIDASGDGEALQGRAGMLLPGTVLVMSVAGFLAVLGPARRGLRIAPVEALKGE